MKKILFPTEFSDQAPELFKYVTEIAYFFKARVIIMHALNLPDEALMSKKDTEKLADATSTKLYQFVKENLPATFQHIPVDYVVKTGSPAQAILETASSEDIDLIVVGMTGKTNALNTLLGRTSFQVFEMADCPVLLVPSTSKFAGIDHIVFTTDFEFRDFGAIQYLKTWSKRLAAPIHCLHIIEEDENELSALKNMQILKTVYRRHKQILFDMRSGDFQEGIEKFAKSKRADMIAMISHKRNLLSRLTKKSDVKDIVRNVQVPILVIKDNAYQIDSTFSELLGIANSIA